MTKGYKKADKPVFDTSINVIGGIKDCNAISNSIATFFSESDSLGDFVHLRNEFDLRTERSRTRVERAVKRSFLVFCNKDHEDLIRGLFTSDIPLQDKQLFLFWQFALNNRLFRDVSIQVFAKAYFSGRAGISKEDGIAYLKHLMQSDEALNLDWSESTISTLSTKYLNFMSKMDFLSTGRIKSFRYIRPSSEAQVLFMYFAKLYAAGGNDILSNGLLPLSFIPREDFHSKAKKLSLRGYLNMTYDGVSLNIDLKHSYARICDVIYNES